MNSTKKVWKGMLWDMAEASCTTSYKMPDTPEARAEYERLLNEAELKMLARKAEKLVQEKKV
jgi:hypothetical protein